MKQLTSGREEGKLSYRELAEARNKKYGESFRLIVEYLKRFFPDFEKQQAGSYISNVSQGEVQAFYGSIHISFPADITAGEIEGGLIKWMKNWDVIIDNNATELHPGIGSISQSEKVLLVIGKSTSRVERVFDTLLPNSLHRHTIQSQNYHISGKTMIQIKRKNPIDATE